MKRLLQIATKPGRIIAGCNERVRRMNTAEAGYNGNFTIEQRKAMTAQMLQELRKVKKLSQKEVAGHLNIPATTYNTYESGRTEPPLEILVRLSYLYGVPVDIIVQRDRTFTNADDINRQLEASKEELAEIERMIAEHGTNMPGATEFLAALDKMADAVMAYAQTESVQKVIEKPLKK